MCNAGIKMGASSATNWDFFVRTLDVVNAIVLKSKTTDADYIPYTNWNQMLRFKTFSKFYINVVYTQQPTIRTHFWILFCLSLLLLIAVITSSTNICKQTRDGHYRSEHYLYLFIMKFTD